MKRLIALILVVVMAMSFVACGNADKPADNSSNTSSEGTVDVSKHHKIGVATVHSGENWEIAKTYLETVIAPTYNFEFVISETLSDANGLIAFMEQCYAAGCDGFINLVTSNDAISQGAHKADELGMWFVTQNSAWVEDVAELPKNIGHCGADPVAVGTAYKEAFSEYLSDGQPHSVILFEGAAVGGDKGQGAASHFYSAVGVLEAFQEAYGLTYDKPIADLVNQQDPGEVNTGNPDVHIYLYPGRNPNDAVTALLPVLQTGNYDIFAAVFSFAAFTNAISDVETSLGKDIKVIGTAQIEKQTKTGFETQDPTGDTVLNSAILNDLSLACAINCIELKQAFDGHADAMKDNGKTVLIGVRSWAVNGPETYAKMEKLNTSPELYILTAEDLLHYAEAGITWQDLDNLLADLASVDTLLERKGLN
ncbi:MAG: hypothetical protein IJ744_01775 [Lachnospiraceae bacterium]|nr:hypothetical protein [Lachnospiraceae bacterium]